MSSFAFSANLIGWMSSAAIHLIVIFAAWFTLPPAMFTTRPEATGRRACIQVTAAWAEPRLDRSRQSAKLVQSIAPATACEAREIASPPRAVTGRGATGEPLAVTVDDYLPVASRILLTPARSARTEPSTTVRSAGHIVRQPPSPSLQAWDARVRVPVASTPSSVGAERDRPPLPWRNPSPDYPALALANGWTGDVLLRLHIEALGKVTRVELLSSSGHDVLDAAAIRAVGKWRFLPARAGGRPIAATVRQPVRFRLD